MNKSKGKVKLTVFVLLVLLKADFCFLCHLFNSETKNFTHLANSLRDL